LHSVSEIRILGGRPEEKILLVGTLVGGMMILTSI